jgi:alpha-beta hydrolase superfamily lysophospholipase
MSDPLQPTFGEDHFQGRSDCQLFFRWARPVSPRATLVVVHGLGEHSGRYDALAQALAAAGFVYYSFDLRGHGKSGGPRGDVHKFDDYLYDLNRFLDLVRQREKHLPIFLMGHSLGGILAVLYALDHQRELAGLVTASTAFQLASPPGALSLLGTRVLSTVAPGVKLQNDLDPAQLSNDPALPAQYLSDPLVERQVTAQWASEFFSNYGQALERAPELTLPLLVLHGGADEIADVAGARAFHERATSSDKTLRVYTELRHELYTELPENRNQVFADLIKWLAAHLAEP